VNVSLTTSEGTLAEQVDKINAAILLDADSNGVIKAGLRRQAADHHHR
jgi:hypothetical protein